MKTVLQNEKECFFCKTTIGLEDHHIFYGVKNRRVSEKYGLKVWLCHDHHTGTAQSVHMNKIMNKALKVLAQKEFERLYGTREDFIKEFGISYL